TSAGASSPTASTSSRCASSPVSAPSSPARASSATSKSVFRRAVTAGTWARRRHEEGALRLSEPGGPVQVVPGGGAQPEGPAGRGGVEQAAGELDGDPGDEDPGDVAGVGGLDDGSGGVVGGRDVETAEVEEDEIGLLADSDAADFPVEPAGPGAFDGGGGQQVADRGQAGVVSAGEPGMAGQAGDGPGGAQLGEHVAGRGGLDVGAEARPGAESGEPVEGWGTEAEGGLDGGGDRERAAGVHQPGQGVRGEVGAVDVGRVVGEESGGVEPL